MVFRLSIKGVESTSMSMCVLAASKLSSVGRTGKLSGPAGKDTKKKLQKIPFQDCFSNRYKEGLIALSRPWLLKEPPSHPWPPLEISCCTRPWCNWQFPSLLTSGSYWKVRFFSGPAKLLESVIWSYWGLWCQTPTDCGLSACQKGVTLAALGNWGSISATHTTNCLDMARAFGRESSTKPTRSSACCNKNPAPTPSEVPATPATQGNALLAAWLRLQEIPLVTPLSAHTENTGTIRWETQHGRKLTRLLTHNLLCISCFRFSSSISAISLSKVIPCRKECSRVWSVNTSTFIWGGATVVVVNKGQA